MGLRAGLWKVIVFSHVKATVADTGGGPRSGGKEIGFKFLFCVAPCRELHRRAGES